jgi:hypothetical protein
METVFIDGSIYPLSNRFTGPQSFNLTFPYWDIKKTHTSTMILK